MQVSSQPPSVASAREAVGSPGGQCRDPIIELRNVTQRYGECRALENFSLAVERGEFMTLLGPSGSGKTTILRLIAGFEQPQSGEIRLEGRDAAALPPYRRNVNTVFQHYALFPHLNVFRNVAFGLEERKLPLEAIRSKVRSILDLVDLPGKEDRLPGQLSGGERQRVALARALVLEPSVLLLDEPLGAVDQKLRKQMQFELRRLRQRLGITFLFVTHDQEEALVMSDRVAVIHQGRLEQIGPGEEVYEKPRTRFVAEFMGVENFLDVTFAGPEEGAWKFTTGSGETLWSAGSSDIEPPNPATLAVRPERLQMTTAVSSIHPRNLLPGSIVESFYEGSSRRSTVELSSGTRFVVREPSRTDPSLSSDRRPGTAVHVFWEPERTLVYPRRDG